MSVDCTEGGESKGCSQGRASMYAPRMGSEEVLVTLIRRRMGMPFTTIAQQRRCSASIVNPIEFEAVGAGDSNLSSVPSIRG